MPRYFDPTPSRTPSKGTVQMIKSEPPKDDPYTRGFNEAKEMAAKACDAEARACAKLQAKLFGNGSSGFSEQLECMADTARGLARKLRALQASPERNLGKEGSS